MPTATRRRAPRRYEPDLDRLETAAAFLKVHPRTVRRMLHDGDLSAYRIRGQLRVDMHEVRALAVPVPPESICA